MKKKTAQMFKFRLYITPNAPQSLRSIIDVRRLFEKNFPNQYELNIIDIYENSPLMKMDQIHVSPTLVHVSSTGSRKMIGDFGNGNKVMRELRLA